MPCGDGHQGCATICPPVFEIQQTDRAFRAGGGARLPANVGSHRTTLSRKRHFPSIRQKALDRTMLAICKVPFLKFLALFIRNFVCERATAHVPSRWPEHSEGSAVLTELRLGRVARDARLPYLRN